MTNVKVPTAQSPNQLGNAIKRGNNFSAQANFYGEIESGMSVRSPMTRNIYELYRPGESIPGGNTQQECRDIMMMCKSAYERVGVIKSVIDMMSEFGSDGLEIVHEDAGPQEFYKKWSSEVNLKDRAERFLSWLYKSGAVVVRRVDGNLKSSDIKRLRTALKVPEIGNSSSKLPLGYIFYNPATIELVGGSLGALSPNKQYGIRVPFNVFDTYRHPKNDLERQVYNSLPPEIKDALDNKTESGMMIVRLPEDKIFVGNYKKDDSDLWGKSFIYSILADVFYNDKLKLAKTSGLDSWYNAVRLWRVGDVKEGKPPSPDALNKLAQILEANTGGGAVDILWDDLIALEEFYPPVDKLVNFEENIDAILLGLGVPKTLVGGHSKDSSSMASVYLGLKNLIKRLEAGRRLLMEWLEQEITQIQTTMGFKKRPFIKFSNSNLYDDKTYFDLLIQLLDRNVISDQTILEKIHEIPEIEVSRIKSETDKRDTGELSAKTSPYHKPDLEIQHDHELKKIRLADKLKDGDSGINSNNMTQEVSRPPRPAGRPMASRDSSPRRRSIKTYGSLSAYALELYDKVELLVKEQALENYSIASLRELDKDQEKELEQIKDCAFSSISPEDSIPKDGTELAKFISANNYYDEFQKIFAQYLDGVNFNSLTAEAKKHLRINAYVEMWLNR